MEGMTLREMIDYLQELEEDGYGDCRVVLEYDNMIINRDPERLIKRALVVKQANYERLVLEDDIGEEFEEAEAAGISIDTVETVIAIWDV